MKRVFPSREVAHLWANQAQSSARNGSDSVSFDSRDFYSSRTCVARICERVVNHKPRRAYVFSMRYYTSTTANHLARARGSVPEYFIRNGKRYATETFSIPEVDAGGLADGKSMARYAPWYVSALEIKAKHIHRTRSQRLYLLNEMECQLSEYKRFCSFFGVRPKMLTLDKLLGEDAAAFREGAQQIADAACAASAAWNAEQNRLWKVKQAEQDAMFAMKYAEQVPEWLAGHRDFLPSVRGAPTLLRISPHSLVEVETSRGASVPIQDAHRLFALWVLNAVPVGAKVGPYEVVASDPERLQIGCHTLLAAEITRFATSQGWT